MDIDRGKQGLIAWFIDNPVAANLLMVIILVMGYISLKTIRLESFPVSPPNMVTISVSYDQGTTEDVEKSILIKIEQALAGIQGIKSYSGTADPAGAVVYIEKQTQYDLEKLLQDIKNQLDGITTFPSKAEAPVISAEQDENAVAWISIQGEASIFELQQLASSLRSQLLRKANIAKVDYLAPREYEISINISREKLQQYHLSFAEVAEALQSHMVEANAGSLKTDSGEILITIDAAAKNRIDYKNTPIRSSSAGGNLYLHHVAEIDSSLTGGNILSFYNERPAIMLAVRTEGRTDIVKAYEEMISTTEKFKAKLPDTIDMEILQNNAKIVVDRLAFTSQSGFLTMLFVLLVLATFLELRLALWVAAGIPVSFAGALIFMPMEAFGLSLNIVTLFAFIVALGIVVDDAIIIGESIYASKESSKDPVVATNLGVKQVAIPATFGVLTSIAAFWPLTRIGSEQGEVFAQIGWVVVFCFVFSLIESKLILPAHLKNIQIQRGNPRGVWLNFQRVAQQGMGWCASMLCQRVLPVSLRYRYFTLLFFIALLILSVGLLSTGFVKEIFFPEIEPEFIELTLTADSSMSVDEVEKSMQHISSSLKIVSDRLQEEGLVQFPPINGIYSQFSGNVLHFVAELDEVKHRRVPANELKRLWYKQMGDMEGITLAGFQDDYVDIDIQLYGKDLDALDMASRELELKLEQYRSINKVIRSDRKGRSEFGLELTEEGRSKGITNRMLTEQVRNAFNGTEIQRIQLEGEEVKVILRYPEEHRRHIANLTQFRVMDNQGAEYPLSTVARVVPRESLAFIYRENGERMVSVSADVNKELYSPDDVLKDLQKNFLTDLKFRYPEIRLVFGGDAEEEDIAVDSLISAFVLTALLIYILLAVPLKSYLSPLIIVSVIPFGFVGVIVGHLIIDIPVSLLSFFGFLALCGVVVNDSLILVTRIKSQSDSSDKLESVIISSVLHRFRAVVLTSLTTFVGLTPVIFATSYQSQLFVPTAVSLGFGIVFSTLTTLILVPSICLIGDDVRKTARKYLVRAP